MVGEALLLGNRIPHFHLSMPWLAGEERPKITQSMQSGGTQYHLIKSMILSKTKSFCGTETLIANASVKAPPMVGPTWTRVRLTLGSDCFPALFQGTALSLPRASGTVYCSRAHDSMIWVIQGCISTSYLSMSP